VATAARTTASLGAAAGLLASVEMAAPPTLLSAPVQIAAETLAVVAVEVKLIAELHEVYRRGVVGSPAVRGSAYLGSWVRRRGLGPQAPVAQPLGAVEEELLLAGGLGGHRGQIVRCRGPGDRGRELSGPRRADGRTQRGQRRCGRISSAGPLAEPQRRPRQAQ